MTRDLPFDSIYRHGFVRAAVCVPRVRVADPAFNLERTLELARRAARASTRRWRSSRSSACPPTRNDDLFHQDALLDAVEDALAALRRGEPRADAACSLVGAPLRFEAKLFNCAVVVHRGRVLGVVPKTYLPNYREFYEKRQFAAGAPRGARDDPRLPASEVPFGTDLIFEAEDYPDFHLHVEICEDLWVPIPPSTYAALAGATVLANLSASNITIGKADYRRDLCAAQSGKCIAAYLYAAAGAGESTTDLAWDGHAHDLRERRAAGRERALRRRGADDHRRHRPRAAAPGPHADDQLQRLRRRPPRARRAACGAIPFELGVRRRCRSARAPRRPLPLRAVASRRPATSAASRPTTSRCTA